jgi:hypothetical protein
MNFPNSKEYQSFVYYDPFPDDPYLAAEIDKIQREIDISIRKPTIRRQIVHVNGEPGRNYNVRSRCKTPQPDIILRTIVVHPSPDQVNLIIERPSQPPPINRDQYVYSDRPRPKIRKRIIDVPSQYSSNAILSNEHGLFNQFSYDYNNIYPHNQYPIIF